MSKFFKDNYRYEHDALILTMEIRKILKPLFTEYMEKGYSPREISHLIMLSVMDEEHEIIIEL